MMPRLLELVWRMSLRAARPATSYGPRDAVLQTIDGMLFVGIRPATHRAA